MNHLLALIMISYFTLTAHHQAPNASLLPLISDSSSAGRQKGELEEPKCEDTEWFCVV
jgi:hypothetical protein